jgi:MFS family permease
VLACFCVAVFSWGFGFYGQAVFLAELQRMHGWPASTIGAATSVFYLGGALLVPFIHQTIERTGPRSLLIGGVVLLGLGAAGFSNAAEPWELFTAGLVMAAGWAASSGPAIATILALWFDRRRGFAISLALNGASASGFTIAPLLVQLSHTIGLRLAVVEVVLVGWVVVIPVILWCARPGSRGVASVAPSASARPSPGDGRWRCRSRWRSPPRSDLSCTWWRFCCRRWVSRAPASPSQVPAWPRWWAGSLSGR